MSTDYKKLTKDQLIHLLIEKDERLASLNARIEKIEAKLQTDSEAKFIERVVNLERNSYRQEQYSRRESIEIVGLPENIVDQEALESKVVELFAHAGVQVTKRDFHAIHRLKKSAVIIAKCVNRRDTTAILRAKKKLRETNDAAKTKLGVTGKIYINESLCPEYRRLFGICNAFYRKKKLASTFTMNGTIKICVSEGGDKHSIGHITDLNEILGAKVVADMIAEHKNKRNLVDA